MRCSIYDAKNVNNKMNYEALFYVNVIICGENLFIKYQHMRADKKIIGKQA